ncbi:MAG: photosystem II reaction center protein Psb28 [Microcoleaceae cyanobacterium]
MAVIQFSRGIDESVVPKVGLTRSRNGQEGTATFDFENPNALADDFTDEITGMYMIDEEGEITTREVNAIFVNGKAAKIKAIYIMRSPEQWDRFMRFMNRYAEQNGLGLSQNKS